MTQTAILAAATAAGTSSDVVLTAGAKANIVGYVATGSVWPEGLQLPVLMDSPSTNPDTVVGYLDLSKPGTSGVQVEGPGTFRVTKQQTVQAVGAYSET